MSAPRGRLLACRFSSRAAAVPGSAGTSQRPDPRCDVPGSRALDPPQPVLPAQRDSSAGPPRPDLAIGRRHLAGAEGVRREPEDFTKLDITTIKGIKRTARRLGPAARPAARPPTRRRLLGYEEARRLIYLPAYRWMIDHRVAGLVSRLRDLASDQTVVLLDFTTNRDITDLSTPFSHAALVAQHIGAPTQAGPVQTDDRCDARRATLRYVDARERTGSCRSDGASG